MNRVQDIDMELHEYMRLLTRDSINELLANAQAIAFLQFAPPNHRHEGKPRITPKEIPSNSSDDDVGPGHVGEG